MAKIDLRIVDRIAWLASKPKRIKIAVGGRGCYPGDTEFMTDSGWKRIDSYSPGDKVLVSDPYTGEAQLTDDVEYIDLPVDRFIKIKNSIVDFTTSIGHRHIARNEKTKELQVITTEQILNKNDNLVRGCKHSLVRTFSYASTGIDLSDDFIRLKIAIIADGHFVKHGAKFNACRVNLKRERKIGRLTHLLNLNKIEFKVRINDDGFHIFSFRMPDNREKSFKPYWYGLNDAQLDVFCDEVLRWDGSVSGKREGKKSIAETFTSVDKETIDFVQFAFHSRGVKADINILRSEQYTGGLIYTMCLARQKIESSISKDPSANSTVEMTDIESSDGRMYCFGTPTGFFVVRQYNKIYVSGNSSKSTGVGDLMIKYADDGERICCTREFQNSIEDSVHENLAQEIDRLGVDGFSVLAKEIRTANGGEVFYKGLARNITSLKSLAGVKKLWIEEGESVSEKSLRVLTPSIRSTAAENDENEDPPEIWITMNRGSSADAIAKKYLAIAERGGLKQNGYYEDDMMMVVEVNWEDNPWFPPELEMERQYDFDNLTRAEYNHIWGGEYNDSVEGAIISAEWFDACIDVHKDERFKGLFPQRGAVIAAHDPSDTGKDSKGFAARRGNVFISIKEKYNCPIDEGCDWATESARALGADWFVWDGDGMGAGLKRQVALAFQGTRAMHHMFRGSLSGKAQDDGDSIYMPTRNPGDGSGAKKKYKDTFYNNRSRYYMDLADKFQATYRMVTKGEFIDPELLISIDSEGVENMKSLRAEVCRIPIKKNTIYNGLIQIMSKADMKKEGIDSPGMADCMMMSLFSPPVMHHAVGDLVPEWTEDF